MFVKRMKRTLPALILLLCTVMAVGLLAGCTDKANNEEKTVKVVVGDVTLDYTGKLAYVGDLIKQFNGEGKLDLEYEDGQYGMYIKKIGSLSENTASGAYIMLYTDTKDVSYIGDLNAYEENGVKFYQTNLGASSMPLLDGLTYMFRLVTYSV